MNNDNFRPASKSLIAITGATGGLGKAFAVECASRGWDLFLTDLQAEPLASLAVGLQQAYRVNVLMLPCDLADPNSRNQLFQHVRQDRLRFWGLINVAGTDSEGPFTEQSRQQIRGILRVNVEGTLEMTHAFLEFREPLASFRIINVSSLAAFYPMPVKATYAASKRFLLDFSLALAEELRDLGVTVTALCPAGLPTNRECIEAIDAQGWMGFITTQNIGSVAAATIDYALKGKAIYIPGTVNRILQWAGAFLPARWVASFIAHRWQAARNKRGLGWQGSAPRRAEA